MTLLLKNGTILDYKTNTNSIFDIYIKDGIIEEISKNIKNDADKIIDCTGLYVMPGMIDMHCHLREPGFTHKETIGTGIKSAIKGGFTTICPMPNTKPVCDCVQTLQDVIKKAQTVGGCNVLPYSSVTRAEQGQQLVDFDEMLNNGAIAFSDDGIPVRDSGIMRQAMIKADELNTFVASHCEESGVCEGAINAGEIATKLGVKGVYKEAEVIMAAREIAIAEINNIRAHICHISTKESVNIIRDAKKRGVKVTCETCPHYYSFTQEEVLVSGTNAKMNPPLREQSDLQAIIEGLKDGTIDCIITDHAPHSQEEKECELSKAPNGIIGFETALAATITNLVSKGYINYLDMVRLMSYEPAKILGIDKGKLIEGKTADITVFNPNEEYIYDKNSIVSKSKNSPFIGKKLKGQVYYTIVNGEIVYNK